MSHSIDIEKFAVSLREALDVKTPIVPQEIVVKLKGTIEEVDTIEDGKEAKIEKLDQSFKIYIRRVNPENRKKFSIAHELGHLFLHMGFIINPDKWANSDEYCESVRYRYGYSTEEREANEFAAALLMPKYEFIGIAQKHLTEETYRLQPIASHFRVSVDAVRMRGRYLGLFNWD